MRCRFPQLVLASWLVLVAGVHAVAGQGGATSSISGVVKDPAGGVMPGVSVIVTRNDTATNKRRRAGKLDTYSAFVQDSWRLTPTLTINAGLRYDVQTPFEPVNDTMSAASLASICGVSGLGDGGPSNCGWTS